MILSRREQRVLALGACIVTLVYGWQWGAALVRSGLVYHADVQARAERLAHTREMAGQLPSLESQVELLRVAYAERTALLAPVRTMGDAQGHLAAAIRELVSPPRATLVGMAAVPDSVVVAGLRRALVRVELETDFAELVHMLGRIERAEPLIGVQSVATRSARAAPRPGFPEVLQSELVLEVWFLSRNERGP